MSILSGRSRDYEKLALYLALHIIALCFTCYACWRYVPMSDGTGERLFPLFSVGLIARGLAAMASLYIHTEVYTQTDLVAYWHDAARMAEVFSEDSGRYASLLFGGWCEGLCDELYLAREPRAFLFARWLSLFYVITGGSAWLTAFWLTVACHLAAWCFYIALVRFLPGLKWPGVISLFFYPSVVFWSSGIQKETVAMAFIFLICSLVLPALFSESVKRMWFRWLAALLLGYLLWQVKYYYAALLMPVLLAAAFVVWLFRKVATPGRGLLYQTLIWLALLGGGVLVVGQMHIAFSAEHFLPLVARTHHQVAERSDYAYHMPALTPDVPSFARHTPEALFAGLYRPLPGDMPYGLLSTGVMLENAALLLLTVLSIVALLNIGKRARIDLVAVAVIIYSLIMATFLAFAMPNYGSLMRYKVAFLPFLLLVLLVPVCQFLCPGKKRPE